MRILIDMLVALMLAAVLAAVVMYDRDKDSDQLKMEATREALMAIRQQVTLQAVLGSEDHIDAAYPSTIDPSWFGADLPRNFLLAPDLPWLEVAGPRDRLLVHPRQRMVGTEPLATFWYNPYQGIVRARVPHQLSDEATLRQYNEVNGSRLIDLHAPVME